MWYYVGGEIRDCESSPFFILGTPLFTINVGQENETCPLAF